MDYLLLFNRASTIKITMDASVIRVTGIAMEMFLCSINLVTISIAMLIRIKD